MIAEKFKIKQSKNYLRFISILVLIGFLIGFLIIIKTNQTEVLNELKNLDTYLNTNHINFILPHIITIIILLISSYTIIGIILFPIYIIYESISISFNLFCLIKLYKFSGFLYGIIYNIITKLIFIILLLIIFKKVLNTLKTVLNKKKNKLDIKDIIKQEKKYFIYYFILIIANDILIYLFGNKILNFFLYIIK